MPTYRLRHTTTFRHNAPVMAAWQVLHLQPRTERNQECLDYELEVSPRPMDLDARHDYFGNTMHVFSLREPHRELAITSSSIVKRQEPALPMAGLTPGAARAREIVTASVGQGEFELEQFRCASPWVPLLAGAGALADGLDPEQPLLSWVAALGARFSETFTFDPLATRLSTPLAEVIASKRGVCQDFAHLFLACVRSHGLPAAYVSGYILTEPEEGKERLVGADASHAWVSIFVPGTGWVDYDPTNHQFVGGQHVVVARGRDYGDVPPTRGIFSGGGSHVISVGVTMEPAETPASPSAAPGA